MIGRPGRTGRLSRKAGAPIRTISVPGIGGGANWPSGAADPETGYVYVGSTTSPTVLALEKSGAGKDASPDDADYTLCCSKTGPPLPLVRGFRLLKPPYGRITAYNMNRGEIAWKVPIGFVQSLKEKGITNTGTLNLGGSIATASGLIFIGATIDCHFRAFESRTGKQLWDTELPACAHSVPMTFLGKDNRQYVVVAAGGGSYLGAAAGSNIVAFALPAGALGSK